MEVSSGELRLELPARPSSVARARHAAVELASAAGAKSSNVALAVSEAVANAVQHAYRGDDGGEITLCGGRIGDRLVVEIVDHGVGMRPNPDSSGLGFGLPLIGTLADEVKIDAGPHGTTVELRFATA